MSDETVLEPIEVKEVVFYDDTITAALVKVGEENQVYVPLRPLCDFLGLSWSGQRERILRDEVLSEALKGVRVTRTPSSDKKRSAGGAQEVLSIALEFLPGWLFGIDSNRVKPELKEKIIRYRRECYRVLWQAFQNEALVVTDPFAVPPKEYQPSQALLEIEKMGLAIVEMARQQMELERRVDHAHERLDNAGRAFNQLAQRIGAVEARLDAQPNYITDRQASEISQRVKDLASHLAASTPGNHYQQIFGEIYRRFGVASYKQLTREQYPAVLEFLNNWHDDPNKPTQGSLF